MNKVESFLTPAQEQAVIRAIRQAEKNTSGEIRVHLENGTGSDPMERATEVFFLLNMHRTALRNAVLIYIAVAEKKFAIIGDKGINAVIPPGFWQTERDILQKYFARGAHEKALTEAIGRIGEKLKELFPAGETNPDELPDEISKM